MDHVRGPIDPRRGVCDGALWWCGFVMHQHRRIHRDGLSPPTSFDEAHEATDPSKVAVVVDEDPSAVGSVTVRFVRTEPVPDDERPAPFLLWLLLPWVVLPWRREEFVRVRRASEGDGCGCGCGCVGASSPLLSSSLLLAAAASSRDRIRRP